MLFKFFISLFFERQRTSERQTETNISVTQKPVIAGGIGTTLKIGTENSVQVLHTAGFEPKTTAITCC